MARATAEERSIGRIGDAVFGAAVGGGTEALQSASSSRHSVDDRRVCDEGLVVQVAPKLRNAV